MPKKNLTLLFLLALILIGAIYFFWHKKQSSPPDKSEKTSKKVNIENNNLDPLTIAAMRDRSYKGSVIVIEQTLSPGANYKQYIASYISDGLKINALLTIPDGNPPSGGWPAIIFNHGYIAPEVYRTTERYIDYVADLANHGYVVFKSDYRGNGFSEGKPEGAYYSPAYTVDVLNALASVKRMKEVNTNKIGMWGHSMGGNITLRSLTITKDIKAAVIWGGVVGSYNDLINNWHRRVPYTPSQRELSLRNNQRQNLFNKYGTLQTNPQFWHSIDPTYFLSDISAPIQLDHGLADEEVPVIFSQNLYDKLKSIGKTVELYTYPKADHNISSPAYETAMTRTLNFFDKYLKN
ncbi:alpha/beta fold hydrolase [Patescibacteria group bacterium]|nr:alpha/beta fold hydrolase [Patescibacteria group bacterium]